MIANDYYRDNAAKSESNETAFVYPLASFYIQAGGLRMPTMLAQISLAATVLFFFDISANATPNCLRDHQPYDLSEDTVSWTMTIAPGADCIQGLRWSYMQIESVSLSRKPKNSIVVIAGSGFRFFASADTKAADSFTLVISGKKGRDAGTSTVDVIVNQPAGRILASSLAK